MIGLTDEEIEQAGQEGIKENFRDISRGVIQQGQDYVWYQRRAIAKAQLKKVVDDIKEHSGTEQLPYRDGGILLRTIPESYFQALLEETK